MKFNRVIHPEVVLGLRGDPQEKNFYDYIHKNMAWDPKLGFGFDVNTEGMSQSQLDNLAITYKFRLERPPVYHVSSDFAKAMFHVDREIPVDLLPRPFFTYFSFPERTVWDGSDWVQGVYVYIGKGEQTTVGLHLWEELSFWAVYQTYGKFPFTSGCARMLCGLRDGKFAEMIDGLRQDDDSINYDSSVFRLALNLALYVNSLGPDLQKAPVDAKLKPAERKALRETQGAFINQCTLPLTLVSWNYLKRREFSVDSTWVDMHPRWQRCGPGFGQVKLIWVRAHERHYNNKE